MRDPLSQHTTDSIWNKRRSVATGNRVFAGGTIDATNHTRPRIPSTRTWTCRSDFLRRKLLPYGERGIIPSAAIGIEKIWHARAPGCNAPGRFRAHRLNLEPASMCVDIQPVATSCGARTVRKHVASCVAPPIGDYMSSSSTQYVDWRSGTCATRVVSFRIRLVVAPQGPFLLPLLCSHQPR